jgi:hypothetical protein
MRRSFRTLRLCAIPGVSPRAGMRCPVGALRTPHPPQSLPAPPRSGSGIGPERALEAIKPLPRAQRESLAGPNVPCERPPNHAKRSGSGRSEHWNVDTLIPIARQRESLAGPNVPCERRTDPAERRLGTNPKRQPWHSATAKQVGAPGVTRRSFRTLRLCAIPGVSPRAGMRCPVGALRTSHLPRAFLRAQDRSRGAHPRASPPGIVRSTDSRRICSALQINE